MKIMVIADEESKYLWNHFDKSKLDGADLIISCGRSGYPRYLSFLVTLSAVPVLYVHGNHDGKYEQIPPEGCTCIEDEIYEYEGMQDPGARRIDALYRRGASVYGKRDAEAGEEASVETMEKERI